MRSIFQQIGVPLPYDQLPVRAEPVPDEGQPDPIDQQAETQPQPSQES